MSVGNSYLSELDFHEPIAIIRVNKLYREDLTSEELYDITRCYWIANRRKAEQCRIALSVFRGIVMEVYKVEEWLDGAAIHLDTHVNVYRPHSYGFVGNVADAPTREKYIGKSTRQLFRQGDQCAVRVFGVADNRKSQEKAAQNKKGGK